MVSALVLAAVLQTSTPKIDRDPYGVPLIKATSWSDAFFQSGYATAQDRIWQMEKSRRVARGRMAEVFGSDFVNADKETLRLSYTDEDLDAQYDKLSEKSRQAIDSYVAGVNAYLAEAEAAGSLPAGYKENGFEPSPWTKEDTLAIGVLLLQQFGRFGAGEIRNMALLAYLDGQPNAKARKLDILDDFIWQNEPKAIPTVAPEDDPIKQKPVIFQPFNRATTEKHLAMLPKVGLFELLPGLRLASMEESKRVAMLSSAPFKAGSYALVASPKRSATGHPILLSGPQMGFTSPSIVYELSIEGAGINVQGMTVPGVPGVVVGATPNLAWGITSGVADTDDVFFYKSEGEDGYQVGRQSLKLQKIDRTLKAKGSADQTVVELRTTHGPVVIQSKGSSTLFVRRPASYMSELQTLDGILDLYAAKTSDQAEQAMSKATMNFNFFYAMADGEIGYRYVGRVPIRAAGLDPRFPTPAAPEYDWKGFVPYEQMPRARNPKEGLLANWNNKPAAWWPNGDAPVWGRVFRNAELLARATQTPLAPRDFEMVPWTIARRSESYRHFDTYFKKSISGDNELINSQARAYDGWWMHGAPASRLYSSWVAALREEIFLKTTGNFLDPQLFALAAGPSVMLNALERKTKVDYLQGRKPDEVAKAAWAKAIARLGDDPSNWTTEGDFIPIPDHPIPYNNRGTYIQIVQMGPWGAFGRNVLPPGESESGPHAFDQVPLAQAWVYKSMRALRP